MRYRFSKHIIRQNCIPISSTHGPEIHWGTVQCSQVSEVETSLVLAKKHMGVSNNRGTPKRMVYKGKPY